jgi:hypothetical protein
MRSLLLGLSFSVVFVLGCTVGVVARQQVARAAPAAGKWSCIIPSRTGAVNTSLTETMNAEASDVPQGAVFPVGSDTICIKH